MNPVLCDLSFSHWTLAPRKRNYHIVRKRWGEVTGERNQIPQQSQLRALKQVLLPQLNLQMRPQSQLIWQINYNLIRDLELKASSCNVLGSFTHRNCEIIHGCCFRPQSLGVISYAAIDNKYRDKFKNKNLQITGANISQFYSLKFTILKKIERIDKILGII